MKNAKCKMKNGWWKNLQFKIAPGVLIACSKGRKIRTMIAI
jgi:hypothetical protein